MDTSNHRVRDMLTVTIDRMLQCYDTEEFLCMLSCRGRANALAALDAPVKHARPDGSIIATYKLPDGGIWEEAE